MAFSTTTYDREINLTPDPEVLSVLCGASTVFCKGDIVLMKAADGYAYPAFAAASSATGDTCLGIACQSKTCGATAGELLLVQTRGIADLTIANTTTQANTMGRLVYNESGATGYPYMVSITGAGHQCQVGVCVGITSTTLVRVLIRCLVPAA